MSANRQTSVLSDSVSSLSESLQRIAAVQQKMNSRLNRIEVQLRAESSLETHTSRSRAESPGDGIADIQARLQALEANVQAPRPACTEQSDDGLNDIQHDIKDLREQITALKQELHSASLAKREVGNEGLNHQKQGEGHQFPASTCRVKTTSPETMGLQMGALSSDTRQDAFPEIQPEVNKVLTIQRLDHHADMYEIQESSWDSSILIGFHCIGMLSSILIIISILATIGIQILLVVIVYANFADGPITDEALYGMLHWRAWAHDVSLADPNTHTSMVSRVCAEETALMMSVSQMNSVSEIRAFGTQGPLLLDICLILWFFSIAHDVSTTCNFTHAVCLQPHGASVIQEDGDTVSIKSFSVQHIAFVIILVSLPRLAISVFLGYTGTFFLAYTTNVGDLLLNAMALVFVLDVDELLYIALIPRRAKQLTKLLDPLRISRESGLRAKVEDIFGKSGMLAFSLRMVGISAAVLVSNVLVIWPFEEKKQLAADYLCGGRKNFIYTTNKVTGLVVYSYVSDFDAEEDHSLSHVKSVALKLSGLDVTREFPQFDTEKGVGLRVNVQHLMSFHKEPGMFSANSLQCIDHLEPEQVANYYEGTQEERDFYLNSSRAGLADSLGTSEFKSCSQLNFLEVCNSPGGVAPRSLCARYCGCDTPWSGQFFKPGSYGCPVSCGIRWELNAYYIIPPAIALYTDKCQDVPPDVLSAEPSWRSYVGGFVNWMASTTSVGEGESSDDIWNMEYIIQHGCGFVGWFRAFVDICSTDDELARSARLWCPLTCSCSVSDMRECPRSCGASRSFEIFFNTTCNYGSGVASEEECFLAVSHSCRTSCFNFEISYDFATKGCWFNSQTSSIIWSNGNQSAAGVIEPSLGIVCKQAAPLPYAAKGPISSSSLLGKHMAECALNAGVWNEEDGCSYGTS